MDDRLVVPMVALEIKKLSEEKWNNCVLKNVDTTVEFFQNYIGRLDRECVAVCCVNNRLEPTCIQIVSIGTSDSCVFSIPEILKVVILSNARGFFIAHNHPSGDLRISKDDMISTQNINKIANIIGIQLLDHFIVSPNQGEYFSFKEKGVL